MRSNNEIAKIFLDLAMTLEEHGDNPYRIRAYRRAAKAVYDLKTELMELVANGVDLTSIPHIGNAIASNILDILKKGSIPTKTIKPLALKNADQDLKFIKWLGPKKIKLLREQFNITTRAGLISAIETGRLQQKPGFTDKLIKKIMTHLHEPKKTLKQIKLYHAINIMEVLLKKIREINGVISAEAVGSYRRRVEIINDLEILLQLTKRSILKEIYKLDDIKQVMHQDVNKIIVIHSSGMRVIFYLTTAQEWGYHLLRLTGTTAHTNSVLQKNNHCLGLSEKQIYRKYHLAYIPPELRENHGEIDAAQNNTLPNLIDLADIKGDLHCHTWETDGTESLEMMVATAQQKGYEYVAITDHSKRLAITNGLDEKRLLQQIKLIDQLNTRLNGFTILKSIEVDILLDGSLDLSNDVLQELDLCVCSIHSHFKLPLAQQTERIIRAMDNPYFTILGHATGRLINYRQPYPIDIEKILIAAKERNCFIELNAQPARLDIKDEYCRLAKEIGVKMAISTDAHSSRELNFMQLGIYQARRGWLEAKDIINTCSLNDFKVLIKR